MKGKLVRDKIPQIIERNDRYRPRTRTLAHKEFERELRKKLVEEALEASKAPKSKLTEELADIEEVIDTLCRLYAIKRSAVSKVQKQKCAKRGGFSKKVFLKE